MSVKLQNASDFSADPVLPVKVIAVRSLPSHLGGVLGTVLCSETFGMSSVCL